MAVILSADDDPDIRLLITQVLTRDGHQVLTASDGQAAVEAAFEHQPDLVILDIDMPRMRGPEACRVLRQDPRTAHIPVILASGSLSSPLDDVAGSGASASVAKPFSPSR